MAEKENTTEARKKRKTRRTITHDRFEARLADPVSIIPMFLSYFAGRSNGKKELVYKLQPFILEYIAECFDAYWQSKSKSLDEAFRIDSKGKGRGVLSPKERYQGDRLLKLQKGLYKGYLNAFQKDGVTAPSDRAIDVVAKDFGLTFETMRQRVRRKRKKARKCIVKSLWRT